MKPNQDVMHKPRTAKDAPIVAGKLLKGAATRPVEIVWRRAPSSITVTSVAMPADAQDPSLLDSDHLVD